jgi:Glutamate-1-semialdehyde aminotransferase
LNIEKSKILFETAKKLIPGQSQTFSKGHTQFVQGVSPIYCEKGKGAKIRDVDGNEYTDYIMALGPIVLGYCFEEVDQAVIQQVKKGSIFSLPHRLEIEVAEALVNIIPSAEMVRFGKNGSDVTAAAIRISRAYTGREKIAICGYHGWQDWYIGTTSRNLGVPASTRDLSLTFKYNDIPSLEKLFKENPGQIACVIIEPIGIEGPDSLFLGGIL